VDRIRALIAEDYAPYRRLLRQALAEAPEVEIVAEVADGPQAVAKARELAPDVVLMDISLPGMGGLAATRFIAQDLPATKVIVLLEDDNREYRQAAEESGASACMLKEAAGKGLLVLVRSLRP